MTEARALLPLAEGPVDAIRRNYARWNEGGVQAMLDEFWHPDIVWHDPPDFPDAGSRKGADALALHLAERVEAFEQTLMYVLEAWRVEPDGLILVHMRIHTGGPRTGLELDSPLLHLLRVEDGLTVEGWEYRDLDQALAVLGVERPPG